MATFYLTLKLDVAALSYPFKISRASEQYKQRVILYKRVLLKLTRTSALNMYSDLMGHGIKPGNGDYFKPWVQLAVNKYSHLFTEENAADAVFNAVRQDFNMYITRTGSPSNAVKAVYNEFDKGTRRQLQMPVVDERSDSDEAPTTNTVTEGTTTNTAATTVTNMVRGREAATANEVRMDGDDAAPMVHQTEFDYLFETLVVQNQWRSNVNDGRVNEDITPLSKQNDLTRVISEMDSEFEYNLTAYIQFDPYSSFEGSSRFKIGYTSHISEPGMRGAYGRLERETTTAGWIPLCELRNGVITQMHKFYMRKWAEKTDSRYLRGCLLVNDETNKWSLQNPANKEKWLECMMHCLMDEFNFKRVAPFLPSNNCNEVFIIPPADIVSLLWIMREHFHCQIDFNDKALELKNNVYIDTLKRQFPIYKYTFASEEHDNPDRSQRRTTRRVVAEQNILTIRS